MVMAVYALVGVCLASWEVYKVKSGRHVVKLS